LLVRACANGQDEPHVVRTTPRSTGDWLSTHAMSPAFSGACCGIALYAKAVAFEPSIKLHENLNEMADDRSVLPRLPNGPGSFVTLRHRNAR
jgi:hypothetical protein